MKKVCLIVGGIFVTIAVILGCFLYFYFDSHFMPNSKIDYGFGVVNVEYKESADVAQMIISDLRKIEFSISDIENKGIKFTLEDVVDTMEYTDFIYAIDELKKNSSPNEINFQLDVMPFIQFNLEKVDKIVTNLRNEYAKAHKESDNAYIYFSEEDKVYKIKEEVIGNVLSLETTNILFEQLKQFIYDIDLVELGCYILPEIYSTDETLLANLEQYKKVESFNLTYLFGDIKETIDIIDLDSWMIRQYSDSNPNLLNPDLPFVLDENYVLDFIMKLDEKYTTYGKARTFKTSTGEVIEMTKGDYGWILNKDKMIEDINSHFNELKSEEKEAIFKQKGYCFGESDFSDSYVEVSIENQRVWMYVNGECIVDTPVVTGNVSAGHNTRKGVFCLTYKTRNATLRGPGYASFVYYWMPFDGGIGLHDATWRGSFGGSIYKTNGSHGCVNMPLEAAKTVYNNLESNMPIIVW